MAIRPLTRRQRTRLGNVLEKVAVGYAVAAAVTAGLSYVNRGWSMIIAGAAAWFSIWLERRRKGRIG